MPVKVSQCVVLRRPSKSILTTKVSIPRICIHACEKCGQRLSRGSEVHESQKNHSRRPHSIHVDQDNYFHLQRTNQIEFSNLNRHWSEGADNIKTRKTRARSCYIKPEHVYEEVQQQSQMKTIDIRLRHKDLVRGNEDFSEILKNPATDTLESDSSEKADNEFEFLETNPKLSETKLEGDKVDVIEKARIFKRKFLTRMTRLVTS